MKSTGFGGHPLGITRSGGLVYSQRIIQSSSFLAPIDFGTGKVGQLQPVSQRFPDSNAAAAWSSDGRQLASLRRPQSNGAPSLLIRRDDASEERELVPGMQENPNVGFSWNTDGSSLWVLGNKDGKAGLYRVDAGNGEATQVWDKGTAPI